ncbi:unnamed protein product [Discula destructiva]
MRPQCALLHRTNITRLPTRSLRLHQQYSFSSKPRRRIQKRTIPAAILIGTLLIWSSYPEDLIHELTPSSQKSWNDKDDAERAAAADGLKEDKVTSENRAQKSQQSGAWFDFATSFEGIQMATTDISGKVLGYILPEWSNLVPGFLRKLQRELSMAPGSLAGEIWEEAHDPAINPEIQHSARVRVSDELCDEEKEYLARRKRTTTMALARYLGLKEDEVHEDDVPTIAMCGSGGGLRALVAGTGSMLATEQDGLFDCLTYTSGVSGSCWLQALYHSSFAQGSLNSVLNHLKARLDVHIAYPPVALSSVSSAPTNKYLLSGLVEKLKGDPNASCGLVDIYGILLAARLLVPKGELGVNARDFKLSNQRQNIKYGQHPMPIYTAVRHEIPDAVEVTGSSTPNAQDAVKEAAAREAWFQWFELTPYETFCEEFGAGIPTWALGRRFNDGRDIPPEDGFHLPEVRMPLLMGIFGSAFCATMSHYYREISPLMQSLTGLATVDEMIRGHNEDLSKIHPIDPATIPNFAYGMTGKLRATTPTSIANHEYLHLMDAGMSNNLPIYPLLRPGRNVEVLLAFDASADVRTDNWLSVADGYARQRGIKGWPLGAGWPRAAQGDANVAAELDENESVDAAEAERRLTEAKIDQASKRLEAGTSSSSSEADNDGPRHKNKKFEKGEETAGELGYCNVWVGTTTERSTIEPPPPSRKALEDADSWQLMEPDAGIAVVYMPFLKNPKVEGVDPGVSEYMSTWNFVYTADEVEKVASLARANYDEGREKIRKTIRAVWMRKRKIRLEREARVRAENAARVVRYQGDHFS